MDDATQKLVDEARRIGSQFEGLIGHYAEHRPLIRALADALEAAQRPPFNPLHESVCRCGATGNGECARRPVSPEAREAIRAVVGEQLTKAGLDLDGPPYSDDGETQWPVALELRDRLTDALLARFSVPSQPVYDEEAIAGWLGEVPGLDWLATTPQELASALVAALRSGELTREETNGG